MTRQKGIVPTGEGVERGKALTLQDSLTPTPSLGLHKGAGAIEAFQTDK